MGIMAAPMASLPDYAGCGVLLLAAGSGRRFGGPKMGAQLMGKTILQRSAEAFRDFPERVAVVHSDDVATVDLPGWTATAGGATRRASVERGMAALDPSTEIVLVHDAARPLVSREVIDRVVETARRRGTAVPTVPLSDTVKRIDGDRVVEHLDRDSLAAVQTPQGFARQLLADALAACPADTTDDSRLVEAVGETVTLVPGDPNNLKITRKEDLAVAEAYLRSNVPEC
jgi:2-C-methyl-D-erythritol 4-phosphate cytidylyltransferase